MSTNSPLPPAQTPSSGEDVRMISQETGKHIIRTSKRTSTKLLAFLPLVTISSFVTTMISDPAKRVH